MKPTQITDAWQELPLIGGVRTGLVWDGAPTKGPVGVEKKKALVREIDHRLLERAGARGSGALGRAGACCNIRAPVAKIATMRLPSTWLTTPSPKSR
jgi:hypothetical protein